MESIFSDHKEIILKTSKSINFYVQNKGIFIIQVSARTKSEKQLGGTDDEDLRIEIDNRKFPLLSNQHRYFDSPAAFSGGATHGLTKVVFFILSTIQEKIEYRAKQYGLDSRIMLRLAKRESQFDPEAISPVGAKGLYQLTKITIEQIRQLGFEIIDPHDVDQNILGAFIYFEWLYKRYEGEKNQVEKTLAAWNYGLAHIPQNEPLDFEELPEETKNLINDVLGDYDF